jgi:tetratricopeptide (TPR) repeat protein
MNVSLCMIVRNEAALLAQCLESARSLVQEVIVVDTGSTDASKAIATVHGARVFDFPWCDDFAAARNESIRHASHPWIFWLDADDRIDKANREKLQMLFANLRDEVAGYMMRRASVAPAGDLQPSSSLVRLFPSDPRIRWERRVHEQIIPSIQKLGGKVRTTDIVVHHHGYATTQAILAKAQRDLRLSEFECVERPLDGYAQFSRGCALADLGRPAEALVAFNLATGVRLPASAARNVYAQMARCYLQEGCLSLALEVLSTGQSLYPNDRELLLAEADLREAIGEFARAEACRGLVLKTRLAAAE